MSLYAKLAEVMGEVNRIPKRGWNDFHNYAYTLEADVNEAVSTALAKRGVAVLPSTVGDVEEREITTQKGATSTISTVRFSYTFVDSESGESHTCEWIGQGDDPADKGVYKAGTGSLKYFLAKAFLIATGDDPEADTGTDQRASERKPSSGPRRGSSKPPSEKQVGFLHTLVKQKIKDVRQLDVMLADIGMPNVIVQEGWAQMLSGSDVSTLIERLKDGEIPPVPEPAPTPSSDVPEDGAEGFAHPQQDMTLEELALKDAS